MDIIQQIITGNKFTYQKGKSKYIIQNAIYREKKIHKRA